ncbi:MAG TPA: phage holin family protein [Caulobacteraceae bacterium]|nr:phage holin family protein [Caulobacteraceae bacterium]
MIRFLLRAVVAAIGFWVAAYLIHGVHVGGPGGLLAAGLVLGIVNALVRPVIVFFTFPLTIVTLGLFLLVVNGISVSLVAFFIHSVRIDTFWHAVLTAVVVSLVSWVGSWFIGNGDDLRRRRA